MKSNSNPISDLWPVLLPMLLLVALLLPMVVIWLNGFCLFTSPILVVEPPLLFAIGAIYRKVRRESSVAANQADNRVSFRFGLFRLLMVMAVIGMSLALTHSQGPLGLVVATTIAISLVLLVSVCRREHTPVVIRTALFSMIGAAFLLSQVTVGLPESYWFIMGIEGAIFGWLVVVIGSRAWALLDSLT